MRIGATQDGSVYTMLLRTLKNATGMGSSSLAAGAEMLESGQVDAFAANKANLFELSDTLPGARVLDGRIDVDNIALALPKGREAGMGYLRTFLEDAKSEGLIEIAVQRAQLRGAVDK